MPLDSHHSKTRLKEFEKVVHFGDTVQVGTHHVGMTVLGVGTHHYVLRHVYPWRYS